PGPCASDSQSAGRFSARNLRTVLRKARCSASHWKSISCAPPARSQSQAQVLDLQIVVDTVLRAFTTEAGGLDAAERRKLGRDQASVDADDTGLDALGDAPDAADVASIEVGGEAERRGVGLGDDVVFGCEAEHR